MKIRGAVNHPNMWRWRSASELFTGDRKIWKMTNAARFIVGAMETNRVRMRHGDAGSDAMAVSGRCSNVGASSPN